MSRINILLETPGQFHITRQIIEAARDHAAVIRRMQSLWEKGLFDEGCAENYAQCSSAFVKLIEFYDAGPALGTISEQEHSEMELLRFVLRLGKDYVPASEVFIAPPPEPAESSFELAEEQHESL